MLTLSCQYRIRSQYRHREVSLTGVHGKPQQAGRCCVLTKAACHLSRSLHGLVGDTDAPYGHDIGVYDPRCTATISVGNLPARAIEAGRGRALTRGIYLLPSHLRRRCVTAEDPQV